MAQQVLIYSKLESFKQASEEIKGQLATILDDMQCNINIYNKGSFRDRSSAFSAVTPVVVIDTRQTRVLLTPTDRDRSIDHWDDLRELSTKISKPRGSFLVFLYGDKKSEALAEGKLISDYFLKIWTYRDKNACCLASKGRCFSLWQQLNETQKSAIKCYFEEVVYLPRMLYVNNMVVFGNDSQCEEFKEHLESYKLLFHIDEFDTKSHLIEERNALHHQNTSNGKVNAQNALTTFYDKSGLWSKNEFCKVSDIFGHLNQLLGRIPSSNRNSWSSRVFGSSKCNRLVWFCQCITCVNVIQIVNEQLKCNFVLPMISKNCQDEVLRGHLKASLGRQMKEEHREVTDGHISNLLAQKDYNWLLRMFVIYACNISEKQETLSDRLADYIERRSLGIIAPVNTKQQLALQQQQHLKDQKSSQQHKSQQQHQCQQQQQHLQDQKSSQQQQRKQQQQQQQQQKQQQLLQQQKQPQKLLQQQQQHLQELQRLNTMQSAGTGQQNQHRQVQSLQPQEQQGIIEQNSQEDSVALHIEAQRQTKSTDGRPIAAVNFTLDDMKDLLEHHLSANAGAENCYPDIRNSLDIIKDCQQQISSKLDIFSGTNVINDGQKQKTAPPEILSTLEEIKRKEEEVSVRLDNIEKQMKSDHEQLQDVIEKRFEIMQRQQREQNQRMDLLFQKLEQLQIRQAGPTT